MQKQTYDISLGDSVMTAEFNDLVQYANGSVMLSMGETTVMAVATMGNPSSYPDGGFPLRVDYEERHYARGAILGGKYNKREGKPTDEATLTARVIDRTIRPFFPSDFRREVQVVVTVLSLGDYDPDVLAVNAACIALHTSDIPWEGPVGCLRVSQNIGENQELVVNPTYAQRKHEDNYFNAIMAGTRETISMIEVEGSEVTNEDMITACEKSLIELEKLCDFYDGLHKHHNKPKASYEHPQYSDVLEHVFVQKFEHVIRASLDKVLDKEVFVFWKEDFARQVKQADSENRDNTGLFLEKKIKQIVREAVMTGEERMDGRGLDEVRSLSAQAGGVPGRQHGTGVFYRGETHVLSVLTLGSVESDLLHHQEMEVNGTQRWMHHYNFPRYSVGETGRMGSPGRREIGHGTLAQKSIKRMLPSESDFPYAIRVVTEVFSSNGSTSMAAVCGSTLALLDGGVPIKKPVGGIAMGLVSDDQGHKLLTDIVGKEDFYGDMDFKIAGTRDGITAIQLDCKIHGLTMDLIEKTLEKSHIARMRVLDTIESELKEPRDLSPHVERIQTYVIPEGKVGLVIGKGGVTIKQITKESGAKIDIKRDGTAFITGNGEAPAKAVEMIASIIKNSD